LHKKALQEGLSASRGSHEGEVSGCETAREAMTAELDALPGVLGRSDGTRVRKRPTSNVRGFHWPASAFCGPQEHDQAPYGCCPNRSGTENPSPHRFLREYG